MSIFVVVEQNATGPGGSLDAIIQKEVPFYKLGKGAWLVAGSGTAKDITEKLGIVGGVHGTAVVTEVASYYGRANPAIWSWIKQNWEGRPVG